MASPARAGDIRRLDDDPFPACDAPSYLTGRILVIDGGWTAT